MKISNKIDKIKCFLERKPEYNNCEFIHLAVFQDSIALIIKNEDGSNSTIRFTNEEIEEVISDSDEHVYCTNCVHGEALIHSVLHDKPHLEPFACTQCHPYNFEDSYSIKIRPCYIEKKHDKC